MGEVSHAIGIVRVPQALQEALPEKVERVKRVVPSVIHDISGSKSTGVWRRLEGKPSGESDAC